jgi:hypothetical protein
MGDNDFPAVMANGGQFLSGYMQRKGLYQQSGTDIPEGSMRYVVEQQLGGPLKGEVEIAGLVRHPPTQSSRLRTLTLLLWINCSSGACSVQAFPQNPSQALNFQVLSDHADSTRQDLH